jgi:hypothetical protein
MQSPAGIWVAPVLCKTRDNGVKAATFPGLTRGIEMSRAFVKEDAGWGDPGRRYSLPDRSDPGYDQAAAEALLEGARSGDTGSAESATGYYWGEKKLRPFVEQIRARAETEGDERLSQLAERYLR